MIWPVRFVLDRFFIKQPRLREWITRMVYGNDDTEIDLMGVKLVINRMRENGYLRASRKVRSSSALSDEMGALVTLAGLLRPGDTFVDGGANVGLFCCTMARFRATTPGLRVVAFEPHPDTFQRLEQNGKRCGVEVFPFGLSSASGEVEFEDGAVSHVFAVPQKGVNKSPYTVAGRNRKVQMRRLDEMIQAPCRVVLKLDVEGHELEALKGSARLFEAGCVKAVLLDSDEHPAELYEFLKANGFGFFDARSLAPQHHWNGAVLALHESFVERNEGQHLA